MSDDKPYDPFFAPLAARRFEREDIANLAAGRCAAITVPDFMSSSDCAAILTALTGAEFTTYDPERVYPPVMRFGVGVSDYRQDGLVLDGYWKAVDADRQDWRNLSLAFDPFAACRDRIGSQWPKGVSVGTRGGRELSPGVAREPNGGFIVHFDDASREFAGNLLDVSLVAQFAFNLYISVPKAGGETVVWRHLWHPGDEAFRLPHSYGYADDVVGEEQSFELKPAIGQALLFNPRYFHAVRPSQEARRIALGFSVGLCDTGELVTWG